MIESLLNFLSTQTQKGDWERKGSRCQQRGTQRGKARQGAAHSVRVALSAGEGVCVVTVLRRARVVGRDTVFWSCGKCFGARVGYGFQTL